MLMPFCAGGTKIKTKLFNSNNIDFNSCISTENLFSFSEH